MLCRIFRRMTISDASGLSVRQFVRFLYSGFQFLTSFTLFGKKLDRLKIISMIKWSSFFAKTWLANLTSTAAWRRRTKIHLEVTSFWISWFWPIVSKWILWRCRHFTDQFRKARPLYKVSYFFLKGSSFLILILVVEIDDSRIRAKKDWKNVFGTARSSDSYITRTNLRREIWG